MEYGKIIWFVEWISEDGEEEDCSYVGTEWFASKAEMKADMKRSRKRDHPDYRYEYFKMGKWYDRF